jgi:3-hydroxyisobutyrate dehydrogenase
MMSIAFVGLGTMGLPMAGNLVAAGYDVIGFDVDPGRAASLPRTARSAAEAAAGADVVITSLPSPEIVEAVAFGPDGVHEGIAAGAVFVDMSTSSPGLARDLARRFEAIGVAALDAPVSGGPHGAKAGTLTVMAGGPAEAFERCRPVFEAVGKQVTRVGDAGAGQVAKLCNNLISGVTLAAISEACSIADREGVPPDVLYELLCGSVGDSRVLRMRFPVAGADPSHPASSDYAPLFALDLLVKDLGLARDLAERLELQLPLLHAALGRYEGAQAAGFGALDYSAVHLLGNDFTVHPGSDGVDA